MTVEVKINGVLLGIIYLRNEQYVCNGPDGELYKYHAEVYRPEDGVEQFNINHVRENGFWSLTRDILTKFLRRTRKEK